MREFNINKGFEHFPEDCLEHIDDPSHSKPGIHALHDRLYVITTVFNPLRFRSRYWNYWTFANMCNKAGAILYTAEIAFGDREFEITDPNNPRHLQLRAKDNQEIWLKENSLNLLIERLPVDWKKVAWIDADIQFTRPDWAQETLQLLEHYEFLQMFSMAQDLDINYESSIITPGFVYGKLMKNDTFSDGTKEGYYYEHIIKGEKGKNGEEAIYRHPGFCWAARREALNKVGGLIDWTILGSGDYLMAHGLFGQIQIGRTMNEGYSENYKQLGFLWQERALKHIRKNVGFMPGMVNHHWHGEKKDRNYHNRWHLLVETKFDPITDLKRDVSGLYQLHDDGTDRFIALRDGLRKYARLRQEDLNSKTIIP
jgi:hypothetical protein